MTHNEEIKSIESDYNKRYLSYEVNYPHNIMVDADEDGFVHLGNILSACTGRFALSDNGCGELTQAHLDVVFNHVHHALIIIWSERADDIAMIRASLPQPSRRLSEVMA